MAAIDFPSSPTTNQVFSVSGKSWVWDGTSWIGLTPVTGYGVVSSGSVVGGSASSAEAKLSIASVESEPQRAPVTNPGLRGTIGLFGSQRSNAESISASDIDCSKGNYFYKTVSGNTTFTVSNIPSSNVSGSLVYSFTLEIAYTSGNITWFPNISWVNSSTPTLATTKTSLLMFVTRDSGANWYGSYLPDFD